MAKTSSGGFNRRNKGWLSAPALYWGLLFVVLFAAAVLWRNEFSNLAWRALAPFERARVAFDASDNARLRAQLASTTALLADRNALYLENQELKARLGRDEGMEIILGAVLMRPPETPYDTLVIDAGASEGVEQGDLVSAGGTTLIGTAAQVYAHTSRVILFSAPGETYNATLRLQGPEGVTVPVNMQGQGGGSLTGQVPAGTNASVGDAIIFPGIASGFAGTVSHVDERQGESFETLYAKLPVDPLALQFVEVWKHSYAGQ